MDKYGLGFLSESENRLFSSTYKNELKIKIGRLFMESENYALSLIQY